MAIIIRQCEQQVSTSGCASVRSSEEPGSVSIALAGANEIAFAGTAHCGNRISAHEAISDRQTGAKDERLLPTTRKGLVALHLRLKNGLANEKRQRGIYELYVRQGLTFQATFEAFGSASSTTRTAAGGLVLHAPLAETISRRHDSIRQWYLTVKPMVFRIAAIFAAMLSFCIIWCEGTIMLDGEPFHLNLSPLSFLFSALGADGGDAIVIACLYIPLLYCALCTYFAMFRMKLCEGVSLHPHQHSDGSALLFNATYACRLGPAICFNYLKLLHEGRRRDPPFYPAAVPTGSTPVFTKSYFSDTAFGEMDQIPAPFGGDYFNNYAPIIIVILCGCTYLNLGTGFLACCAKCFPCIANDAFSFDDDFSDTRIDHGAQILAHEKQVCNTHCDVVPSPSLVTILHA